MAEKLSFDRQCRSEVWKHFEKKQIEGKLYSVCGRCGKKLRYFGGTSSMRAHWKTSHAAEALDEDGSGKGSQRGRNHQSSIAQFVQRARPPSNCPLWKVNGANDLLVRWCWTNLRPLDIVNDEGLRDFVKFLEPSIKNVRGKATGASPPRRSGCLAKSVAGSSASRRQHNV